MIERILLIAEHEAERKLREHLDLSKEHQTPFLKQLNLARRFREVFDVYKTEGFRDIVDKESFRKLLRLSDLQIVIHDFTDEAIQVVVQAGNEALRLKHDYVGTEHLLLALTHYVEELPKLGATYERIFEAIKKFPGIGDNVTAKDLALTPSALTVVAHAVQAVRHSDHKQIWMRDILQGLVGGGEDSVTARLLDSAGVDRKQLRATLDARLGDFRR